MPGSNSVARSEPWGWSTTDPTTGTLRFVGRLDGFLTPVRAIRSASAVALDYVRSHRIAFGLSRSDLRTFRLHRDYVDVGGTHHLAWAQRVGGVEVFPNGLEANVTVDGRLINVSGSPAAGLRAPSATARLGAGAAVAAARVAGGGAAVRARGDLAERVLFATGRGRGSPGRRRPGWGTTCSSRWSTPRTATSSGARTSRAPTCRDGAGRRLLPRRQRPERRRGRAPGVVPGRRRHGPVGATHVGADVNDNGLIGPAEEIPASPAWTGTTRRSSTPARRAALLRRLPVHVGPVTPFSWEANRNHFGTQLYHLLNAFHDHLLAPPIAFTEAAGNFQVANPSGQGLGGDPVEGHALLGAATNGGLTDVFHRNNAFMSTPPTERPRSWGCSCSAASSCRCTAATTPRSSITSTPTGWSPG